MSERDEAGRFAEGNKPPANATSFKPGRSGNPGGPPKNILAAIRREFGGDVPAMMRVLRDLGFGKIPAGYELAEIKTSDRVKSATEFLDRLGVTVQRMVTITNEPSPAVADMTKLTDAQLEALAAIEFVAPAPDDATEH